MKEKWREKTEKIGKLLKLLNEYETPRSGVVYKSYDDYDGFFYGVDCDGETEIAWSDSLICSKKFGWIWWLVENEKIDLEYLKSNTEFMFPIWKEFYQTTSEEIIEYSNYESLLMLLAIQDEPIRFLCEILK